MKTEIIANLRDVLATLYADEASIQRVIFDADLNAVHIALGSAAVNNWHAILLEAEKMGRTDALLHVVERHYGTNPEFRIVCAAYRSAINLINQSNNQSHSVERVHQGSEPLMNCVHEMAAFRELLDHEATTQRAILLQGSHGCGKTRLLKEYRRLAEERQRKVIEFDLSKQLSIEHCLERIVNNSTGSSRFMAFEQSLRKKKPESLSRQADWHVELTRSFFNDLRGQRTAIPIFVFFDHLEKADRPLRNWLLDEFIVRLAERPLLTVLAGHAELERMQHLEWVRFFTPKIPQIEHFYDYARCFNVELDRTTMNALFSAFQTTPKSFTDYVDAMCRQQQGQLL